MGSSKVVDATTAVASGRQPFTAMVEALVAEDRQRRQVDGRLTFGWGSLTPAEATVAAMVAAGDTNPEIAVALYVGRETVKSHVASILRKLGLTNRTQFAAELATVASRARDERWRTSSR